MTVRTRRPSTNMSSTARVGWRTRSRTQPLAVAPVIGSSTPSIRRDPSDSGELVSSTPSAKTRTTAPAVNLSAGIEQAKPLNPSWSPVPTSSRRKPLATVSATTVSLTVSVIRSRRRPYSAS